MGYQTLVVINNDHIHHAKDNLTIGTELYQAVLHSPISSPAEFGQGIGRAYRSSHADQVALIAFGNLQVAELAATRSITPDYTNTHLFLLKEAARKLGYRLHRIP